MDYPKSKSRRGGEMDYDDGDGEEVCGNGNYYYDYNFAKEPYFSCHIIYECKYIQSAAPFMVGHSCEPLSLCHFIYKWQSKWQESTQLLIFRISQIGRGFILGTIFPSRNSILEQTFNLIRIYCCNSRQK